MLHGGLGRSRGGFHCSNRRGPVSSQRPTGGRGAKLPEISVKNLSFPMDWTIGLVDSSPHPSTRFDRLVTYATLPSPHTTLSTPFRLPQPVWKNTGSTGEREPCRAQATSAVRASDTQQHPLWTRAILPVYRTQQCHNKPSSSSSGGSRRSSTAGDGEGE